MSDKKPVLVVANTIDETGQFDSKSPRKRKLAHLFDKDEE